jgi:hypothetical protein
MVMSEPVFSCAAHFYLSIDEMSIGFVGISEKYVCACFLQVECPKDPARTSGRRSLSVVNNR